jgi:hypothetical protein
MKIYTVKLDMTLVLARLKKFRLGEFNSQSPILFIEADDPDDACYFAFCKFSEMLLKQDESVKTAQLVKSLQSDIRITKVFCKDEQKKLR